jgi:heme-degrading monooxygenase HmoA
VAVFIAMNRFKVPKGKEAEFENVWLTREVHMNRLPGFLGFHMLRGPVRDDHQLYSSHTLWASKQAFEDWTRSEAFAKAHRNVGMGGGLYLGHPEFEGFESIQEVLPAGETVPA